MKAAAKSEKNTKNIQEQFGSEAIEIFARFARADIPTPATLQKETFSYIGDPKLRKTMAQVFYGARWMYKLGLALLVKDEERAAHVRAQIVDYASIAEAILSYCVRCAIDKDCAEGEAFKWKDPDRRTKAIKWGSDSTDALLGKQSLWWLGRVATECKMITPSLAKELDWLRKQRNFVHVRERAAVESEAYLNQSKKAFDVLLQTINETKHWKSMHP